MSGERRNKVYEYISGSLANGALCGGDRISEIALAESLGVSRTPVREAIRQLEAEGFVVQFPRVGTFVRKVDRRDMLEFYEEREAIEPYVAGLAAERISQDVVGQLNENCAKLRALAASVTRDNVAEFGSDAAQRMIELDSEFHHLIAGAAGNRRLAAALDGAQIFRNLLIGVQEVQGSIESTQIEKTAGEHQAVVDALAAKDPVQARTAMLAHIALAKSWTIALYDRRQDDGSSHYYDQVSVYM